MRETSNDHREGTPLPGRSTGLKHCSRTFRVVADELWGVAANLDMANMEFEEFADAVDEDGVFRGFA
jgi:hypothetical protein